MVKLRFIQFFFIVAGMIAFGLGSLPSTIRAAVETPPVPGQGVQVLASGPIHEAFAEPVVLDPEPGIVAPKAPPAPIEEIPPEQKPEGEVQWIPGYWAWDDERNEYIWVSGIWRVPPPSQQWVPGYWSPVGQGYQWVSGYWASMLAEETEYLPEPPESVEVGPSSNAPSPDYIWIPGCWVWYYGRYAWRPGYWTVVHPDWIWVPDHYIWTPRGYIFVSGYWDYTVIHRGVLFAPVFFPPWSHIGLAFSFSPGFIIDLNVFYDSLFLWTRHCHYYYGDYYAPKYYRRGIYPWFSLHARRVFYDPFFAHQRWKHRNDRGWENRLQRKFRERREHEGLRPVRSFDLRTGPDKAVRSSGPERINFVMPLDRAGKTKASAYRFKPLSKKERREFYQREKEVRAYRNQRQSRETQRQHMLEQRASKRVGPNKDKISRSPIMDRSNEKVRRKKAPPARYRAPKPNTNIEPLERKYDLSRSRGGLLDDRMKRSNNWQQRSGGGRQRMNER